MACKQRPPRMHAKRIREPDVIPNKKSADVLTCARGRRQQQSVVLASVYMCAFAGINGPARPTPAYNCASATPRTPRAPAPRWICVHGPLRRAAPASLNGPGPGLDTDRGNCGACGPWAWLFPARVGSYLGLGNRQGTGSAPPSGLASPSTQASLWPTCRPTYA